MKDSCGCSIEGYVGSEWSRIHNNGFKLPKYASGDSCTPGALPQYLRNYLLSISSGIVGTTWNVAISSGLNLKFGSYFFGSVM